MLMIMKMMIMLIMHENYYDNDNIMNIIVIVTIITRIIQSYISFNRNKNFNGVAKMTYQSHFILRNSTSLITAITD